MIRAALPLALLACLIAEAAVTGTAPRSAHGLASTARGLTEAPQTATGEASWYDDGPGLYGAVHSYRWGDRRYNVRVCRADNADVCVTVTVRDHMANRVRAIDLSPQAFSRLAPLSRGVVQVTVSRVGAGPRMTLPPTSTEG